MITIGYSTREIDQNYIDHIKKTVGPKNAEIIPFENKGTHSLSEVYNIILEKSKYDTVVLIHDDLIFETNNWGHKLNSIIKKNNDYGVIGLAGSKYVPKSGMWWEIPETMYGIVNHQDESKKWESKYSKDIKNRIEPTVIIDGLFMVIRKSKITKNFDESVGGFHFYDMNFCVPNFLDGVKIGITTSVRVTHLSIGQTNESWDKKRIDFSKKYSSVLPLSVNSFEDLDTFIIVHDQKIILEYEEHGKYKNIPNVKYLFVGNGDIDKINLLPNVIICRNLDHNIEQYPNINVFTAWYAVWKNNLSNKKYINFLEYDTIINETVFQKIPKIIENGVDMIRFLPRPCNEHHFIDDPRWVSEMLKSISRIYRRDMYSDIKEMLKSNPNMIWTSTSNTIFKKGCFEQYMNWFLPLLPDILESKTAGHQHERSMTIFNYMFAKKLAIIPDLIEHFQLDSHETQDHVVDFESSLQKLIKNEL